MNHPIEGMLGVSMEKIREMVDVNTVIGDPITTPDGLATVIPVSRVSFGFGSGGSDLPAKSEKELFGGGAGAGVTIRPVGFLVIKDGDVKLLQMEENSKGIGNILESVPGAVSKLMHILKDKKATKNKEEDKSK